MSILCRQVQWCSPFSVIGIDMGIKMIGKQSRGFDVPVLGGQVQRCYSMKALHGNIHPIVVQEKFYDIDDPVCCGHMQRCAEFFGELLDVEVVSFEKLAAIEVQNNVGFDV